MCKRLDSVHPPRIISLSQNTQQHGLLVDELQEVPLIHSTPAEQVASAAELPHHMDALVGSSDALELDVLASHGMGMAARVQVCQGDTQCCTALNTEAQDPMCMHVPHDTTASTSPLLCKTPLGNNKDEAPEPLQSGASEGTPQQQGHKGCWPASSAEHEVGTPSPLSSRTVAAKARAVVGRAVVGRAVVG